MDSNDQITAVAFSMFENKGVYALLLGSGISTAAGIPTGWAITESLVRRIAAAHGVQDPLDWAKWYLQTTNQEPRYSDLLQRLAPTQDERRSVLHNYIEPTEEELEKGIKVPTKAHRAIANLVKNGYVRFIITTNFDRLLENALKDVGVEPTVIFSDDSAAGATPLMHTRCSILKLHGDYLDSRIKNTQEELGQYSDSINGLLDRILDECGLIVCGWSADWDEALRAAILRAPNRRFPMYWIRRSTPSPLAQSVIDHRRGSVIESAGADSFFEDLQIKVAAQEKIARQHPLSAAALVTTAKRFLARPEYRIELADLVQDEHQRLRTRIDGDGTPAPAGGSRSDFIQAIRNYEVASETMMRLFLVLGLWGSQDEVEIAKEKIRDLFDRPPAAGSVLWNALRDYPAMLLVRALGLGLMAKGRLVDLYSLLTLPIYTNDDPKMHHPCTALFLNILNLRWEAWKNLPDQDGMSTPLSNHLHDLFIKWRVDLAPSDRAYDLVHRKLELLGAIAYCQKTYDAAQVNERLQRGDVCWIPYGRWTTELSASEQQLSEWERDPERHTIAFAGFGNKDPAYLSVILQNLRTMMNRVAWL